MEKDNFEGKIMRLGDFKGQGNNRMEITGRHFGMRVLILGGNLEFEISI